nr:bifunctional adenosylcobinamide kinase/adenosylcobinamide-phosphate guanylyltransferase [Desulfobacterales bacterium]
MKEILLVTGGCRSGKSRFALEYANKNYENKVYIATCEAKDKEMQERIRRHQQDRGPDWKTVEEPIALSGAVNLYKFKAQIILIDCLTFWVSNLLMKGEDEKLIMQRLEELTDAIQERECTTVLVSNEVGAGIVPVNPLARQFRDIIGSVNQRIAAIADDVVWMVAGIPVFIKRNHLGVRMDGPEKTF